MAGKLLKAKNKKVSNAVERLVGGQYVVVQIRDDLISKIQRIFKGEIDFIYFVRQGNSHLKYAQKVGDEMFEVEEEVISSLVVALDYTDTFDDWNYYHNSRDEYKDDYDDYYSRDDYYDDCYDDYYDPSPWPDPIEEKEMMQLELEISLCNSGEKRVFLEDQLSLHKRTYPSKRLPLVTDRNQVSLSELNQGM